MIREFIAEMITAAMVMNGLRRILGHYFPVFLFVPVPAGRLLHGFSGLFLHEDGHFSPDFIPPPALFAQKTREGQLNPSQGQCF